MFGIDVVRRTLVSVDTAHNKCKQRNQPVGPKLAAAKAITGSTTWTPHISALF